MDHERTKRRKQETEDAIGDYHSFCDFSSVAVHRYSYGEIGARDLA
jgi:hypothetical protein